MSVNSAGTRRRPPGDDARLELFDLRGHRVRELCNGLTSSESAVAAWDGPVVAAPAQVRIVAHTKDAIPANGFLVRTGTRAPSAGYPTTSSRNGLLASVPSAAIASSHSRGARCR